MNLANLNFNLEKIGEDFLGFLKSEIDSSFKKVNEEEDVLNSNELWWFRAKNKKRQIFVLALANGRVVVTLQMEGLESFFGLEDPTLRGLDTEGGIPVKEFQDAIPYLKDFLLTGKVDKSKFHKVSAEIDDWFA